MADAPRSEHWVPSNPGVRAAPAECAALNVHAAPDRRRLPSVGAREKDRGAPGPADLRMPKLAAGAPFIRSSGRREHEGVYGQRRDVRAMVLGEIIRPLSRRRRPNPRPHPRSPTGRYDPSAARRRIVRREQRRKPGLAHRQLHQRVEDPCRNVAGCEVDPRRSSASSSFRALASAAGQDASARGCFAARSAEGLCFPPSPKGRRGPGGRPPAPRLALSRHWPVGGSTNVLRPR